MDLDNNVKNLLPKRPKDSHKGAFGHVLNVAGSEFYSGAAYFSSISALKVGCGKITLASVEKTLRAVASLGPDIILMPLDRLKKNGFNGYESISIGCGLSVSKSSIKFFNELITDLKNTEKCVVIDADGLNILAETKVSTLPLKTILTPHPKELSRLMEVNVENILLQPEFWAKKCSDKYNCTTVLKLHNTIVSDNRGHFYVNDTGNSALSHGGSGDVLCGMISGFLAQGLNPFDASSLAVYLHGIAAELASKKLTEYSTLASDLLNYLPEAIKTIL